MMADSLEQDHQSGDDDESDPRAFDKFGDDDNHECDSRRGGPDPIDYQ